MVTSFANSLVRASEHVIFNASVCEYSRQCEIALTVRTVQINTN